MTMALTILIVLTAWHYLWDGILAPSFRAEQRFKLFQLRDELRELHYAGGVSTKLFRRLEDSLNGAIEAMPSINLTGMISFVRAVENDARLRQRIEARIAEMDAAPREVQEISKRFSEIMYTSLGVNIGAWLIPLVAIQFPLAQAVEAISRLIALTEQEIINRFSGPPGGTLAISN